MIVVDCPGNLEDPRIASVLEVADFCLVPLSPSPADLYSTVAMIRMIESMRSVRNPNLSSALMLNSVNGKTKMREEILKILRAEEIGEHLLDSQIAQREVYRQTFALGTTIHHHNRYLKGLKEARAEIESWSRKWPNTSRRRALPEPPMAKDTSKDKKPTGNLHLAAGLLRGLAQENAALETRLPEPAAAPNVVSEAAPPALRPRPPASTPDLGAPQKVLVRIAFRTRSTRACSTRSRACTAALTLKREGQIEPIRLHGSPSFPASSW